MNAAVGSAAVALGLIGSVLGVATLALGLRRGDPRQLAVGRRMVWFVLGGAVLATIAMESALIGHDFSLRYVASNNSRATPLLYTVTGMWSALEGSILLWALVLAGYLAAMAHRFRHRASDPLVAWALLVGMVVAVFFFGLMVGPADPFAVVSGAVPADGAGPNPLLQNHPLVAFHPPMLYLGYVGFTVPFAFALASLATGRLDERWMSETRRWSLAAWAFLTAGIVLGAWWSYEVLGWGGYWAWDPVENASFLPWLTATAYLHSSMVQERRGMLRVWNLSLLVATFALTILGTFLTRSGVLNSVHAFTESGIGPAILGFFAVVVVVSVGLIGWRGDQLRSPGSISSAVVSREGAFLANNVAFSAFAFVVLLGTVFPLVAEALSGDRLSVGAPYFERMTMPIGFALLFLMAVAPVLPWRKTSVEHLDARLSVPAWAATLVVVACVLAGVRGLAPLVAFGLAAFAAGGALGQLRRAVSAARATGGSGLSGVLGRSGGGMVVHLGVVLVAVALAASSSYGQRRQVRLVPGQTAEVAGHTVTYLGTRSVERDSHVALMAGVRVDGAKVYEPSLRQFPGNRQAIGTPSVRTGLFKDVYLTLVTAPPQPGGQAVIGVDVQPLVLWLWVGGGLMLLGTAMAAWPSRRRRRPSLAPAAMETRPSENADEHPGLVTTAGDRQGVS